MALKINTPRWSGVPFILKAGKALNEKKAEMRVQFKDAPAANFLFKGEHCPRNELVMRMQPKAAVYLKTNVKSPGFSYQPIQTELEVNYDSRFFAHSKESAPDAYTRLILDVCHGKHAAFVRDDELRRAWEIFTPLLHQIETTKVRPITYTQGGRGPEESDTFIRDQGGYIRNVDYIFYDENDLKEKPKEVAAKLPEHCPADMCDVGLYGLAVMVRTGMDDSSCFSHYRSIGPKLCTEHG